MNLTAVAGPLAEPISLAEAKAHLQVTETDRDSLITTMIAAARAQAETYTGRALITRTLDLRLDAWPGSGTWFTRAALTVPPVREQGIWIPRPPLRSITSITYIDQNGATQTWSSSLYTVDAQTEPGRIEPAYGEVWPVIREQMNAIKVRFVCGHATKFTAAAATDLVTASGHALADTDVTQLSFSGGEDAALPASLALNTDYYARDVTAGTSLKLAATSGGAAIDITDAGTATASFFLGVVPREIRQAMLLMIGDMYAHREDTVMGVNPASLPRGVESLLWPHRLMKFA